jgi:hypothetical protein
MKLSRETALAAAAGVLVLVIPSLFFPYPPFHDMVALVGMQSYPPKMSYGPTHYYVFQFTYFLHHLISRVLTELGIGTQGQSRFYYLFQALGYFAVIVGLLNRFLSNERAKAVAILAGALAFTDGMFAIGGPLPFSLAGVLIMVSVLLIAEAREADRVPSRTALLMLAFLAMLSHPFAAPFLLLVYGVSFVATPRQRVTSLIVTGFVLFYALLIALDSPESASGGQLSKMFDFNPGHVWKALSGALTWDANYIFLLFEERMPVVSAYVHVIAAIKLIGALLAAAGFTRLWSVPRLRFLLLLEIAWVALYATATDADSGYVVAQWPWRILSIGNPLLYCFPVIAAAELATGLNWPKLSIPGRPIVYAMLAALTAILLWFQFELLRKGRDLEAAFQSVKATVLASGAHDAVVTWDSDQNIHPYYLRCAPFLLIPDRDLLARKLLFVSGWHVLARHNTHAPELDFPSARPRLSLEFLPSNGTILAVVRGLQQQHFPMKVRFGGRIPRVGAGEPILTTGKVGDANILYALAPTPGVIQLYLDAWGAPWVTSPPLTIDPNREYTLDVVMSGSGIKVQLDGVTVWEQGTLVRSLDNPVYGSNPVGGTTAGPTFSGTVTPLK